MSAPFNELRERLLRSGVAPRHVRRYVAELRDHLADLIQEERALGRTSTDAESAALIRLGTPDDLARAVMNRRELRSWCARSPWATLGMIPLAGLAVAYFAACFILWSGWRIFLPEAPSPFAAQIPGSLYGVENIYFQIGRMIYFGTPILIGWTVAVVAVRQRFSIRWPLVDSLVIAFVASMAQVQASRPTSGAGGHVSMTLALPSSAHELYMILMRALLLFSLTLLPYVAWRLKMICFRTT